jgi:hypothetical protein
VSERVGIAPLLRRDLGLQPSRERLHARVAEGACAGGERLGMRARGLRVAARERQRREPFQSPRTSHAAHPQIVAEPGARRAEHRGRLVDPPEAEQR